MKNWNINITYADLKVYCDQRNITYQEFGKQVDPSGAVNWNTIYQVITGKQERPSKRTRKVLDEYIKRNRSRILKAIGKGEEPVTASGDGKNLVIVHGVMPSGTVVRSIGNGN